MLTRSGVAKSLRCSLATVRRLEGRELFPERDARGVHWFQEREVERVRTRLAQGRASAAKGDWLATAGPERRGSKFGPRAGASTRRRPKPAPPTPVPDADALALRVSELGRENERLREENVELQRRLSAMLASVTALLERGPVEEILDLLQAAVEDLDE